MSADAPLVVTATRLRAHLGRYVDLVRWRGRIVLITVKGQPRYALVPLALGRGRGVTIVKQGEPVAELVKAQIEAGHLCASPGRRPARAN